MGSNRVLRRVGVALLVAAPIVGFLGLAALSAPTASAQSGSIGSTTDLAGQLNVDLACTSGTCAFDTAKATLNLTQSGNTVTGTATTTGRTAGSAVGTTIANVKGIVHGKSAALTLDNQPGEYVVTLGPGMSISGLHWVPGPTGGFSSVTGTLTPAAAGSVTPTPSTPKWTGNWSFGIECVSKSTCANLTADGVLDLVQNGNAITGSTTATGESTSDPLNGTASGLSATFTAVGPPDQGSVSTTIEVTMATNGSTFSGTSVSTSGGFTWMGAVTGKRQTVPAGTLAVAVSTNVPDQGLPVRRTADVTVQVTAVGGPVDAISLGNGLAVSGPALEVTSTPSGLSGFSLPDGQAKTFAFGVKGVKAGEVTATADATGKDKAGGTVTASGSAPVKVGGAQIEMFVSSAPDSLTIRKGVSGQAPTVTVKVRMRNPGQEPVEHVQLLSLVPTPVDHTQSLKRLRFSETFPRAVGTIAPGGEKVEKFKLDATGGFGRYEVEALALFDDPIAQGGNGRAFATGPVFDVVTTEATKFLDVKFNGKRHELYYDPATGAILGKLPVFDALRNTSAVFFYDPLTGNLDVRDRVTGQSSGVSYDSAKQTLTIPEPSRGRSDVMHYNAKSHELEFLNPDGTLIVHGWYDQEAGKFQPALN